MTPEDAREEENLKNTANLAKPFLEECERLGFEAIALIAYRPGCGYVKYLREKFKFINHPQLLLHIALARRTTFETLKKYLLEEEKI